MAYIEPILLGIAGGIFGELFRVFELRHRATKDWPHWVRLKSYWWITAGMVLAGGLLVFLHQRSGTSFAQNAWLAVNIGASAPLLLRQLSAGVSVNPGPSSPDEVN